MTLQDELLLCGSAAHFSDSLNLKSLISDCETATEMINCSSSLTWHATLRIGFDKVSTRTQLQNSVDQMRTVLSNDPEIKSRCLEM